jgi:choline-sulfatase
MRERSIAYLEARKRESRPFCLTVSIRYPHGPHNPVKRFADMYDPASIEIPTDHWDDMENLPERVRRFVKRVGRRSPRDRQPRGALQRQFSHRYALVTQIDDAVGAIMKHVDLADTLVFFSSDHGDYMGRRGRLGKQPFMGLEPVGRVPFFACGPGVPAGASVESPTALVDLAPTFLRAAGLEIPEGLDGLPLQNYFEDPDYGSERSVFCWGLRSMHMIRRGRFKFFRTPRGDAELLFDLAADPNEMKNLAGDPRLAPVVQELAQELDNVRNKPPHALPRFPKARAARSPL